jgi:pimeloyl-ACP methyl ester carboxylesterase
MCAEIVIALLAKLGIQHVSLAAHSAGTVYALDMLLHHPDILSPSRPYLALGAPWLLPKHTSSTAMAMIQRLPNSAIGNTHSLMKLMNQVGGSSVASSFASASSSIPDTAEADDEVQVFQKTWPSVLKRMYSEDTKGISAEALLLLQKVGNGSGWDDWGDYDSLIPRLVQSLRAANLRLQLEIFYAEKDWMIGDAGTRGPAWFDECWTTQAAEVVDHHSNVVAGADHDSVWDLQWDATRTLFESIRAVR